MTVLLLTLTLVPLFTIAVFAAGAYAGISFQRRHPEHRVAEAGAELKIAGLSFEQRKIELDREVVEVQGRMQINVLKEGEYRQALAGIDTTFTADEVGAMLRATRKERGLSQDILARRAGVPLARMSAIELGHEQPRPEDLKGLADVLDLEYVPAIVRVRVPRPSAALVPALS